VSKHLLPLVPAGLVVDQVLPTPDHLTVMCRSRITAPVCPGCGHPSSRRHSSYPRRLADLPWQGRRVQIEVQVRRLRCGRPGCTQRIFAERLPVAAGPYAQRTARLGSLQHHIGLALGGKAGARLAERIGTPVNGATLLRLVRRGAATTPVAAPRVLGVDDWAWKRCQRYGSEEQPGPAAVPAVQLPLRPAAYPARRVARMLTADLTVIAAPDRSYVERLVALSPMLATVRDLAQRFGVLVRAPAADALTPWLADAENSELRGFAAGLRQDEQAVRAALTLPWSSGQVEGQVNRLKLVKRQGYGRAKLDLLRARLVHTA